MARILTFKQGPAPFFGIALEEGDKIMEMVSALNSFNGSLCASIQAPPPKEFPHGLIVVECSVTTAALDQFSSLYHIDREQLAVAHLYSNARNN